ncbi:MAG: hypothetical protein M3Y84_06875 [Acidobacteriota bacterium]|nr:hypothetical protein [Acidobacteriota bacterium]
MNLEVVDSTSDETQLRWNDLSDDVRNALAGKLSGLWGAIGDEDAFNSISLAKQQALLLILSRLLAKGLWQGIENITNVYGEGGVGMEFTSCPAMESTLSRRNDFTQLLANHRNTKGAFYEKGQAEASLHLLYVEETARKWYVHFDLYSPVHSPISAFKHFRHEFIGKVRPDWRVIKRRLID